MYSEFADKVAEMYNSKINPVKLENMLDIALSDEPTFRCYVYEVEEEIVGYFGGIISEALLTDDIFLQEINFIFKEGFTAYAPYLLKGVKKAVAKEVDGIMLAHMSDNKLTKLYNILGFNELETHYLWKQER